MTGDTGVHGMKVDLHERSWVENAPSATLCTWRSGRPPREVVSWKFSALLLQIAAYVDLHERSWVEKPVSRRLSCPLIVDLHERSWVEKSSTCCFKFFTIVDLHERAWVEKFFRNIYFLTTKSISTRGRELKKLNMWGIMYNWRVDLHERSWVEKCICCKMPALRFVDLHERSWVEKLSALFCQEAFLSISTRGRELKKSF